MTSFFKDQINTEFDNIFWLDLTKGEDISKVSSLPARNKIVMIYTGRLNVNLFDSLLLDNK